MEMMRPVLRAALGAEVGRRGERRMIPPTSNSAPYRWREPTDHAEAQGRFSGNMNNGEANADGVGSR
jgi:hypothetical protein